jgi:hypothetical protein
VLELDGAFFDHGVVRVDRSVRADGQRDGVTRPRVDLDLGAVDGDGDDGVERVLAELRDGDADDSGMSVRRSCVMGRGVFAPWSFMRMAAASG